MNRPKGSLPTTLSTRWGEIGLALLCLFVFCWRLGAARLFDMDEGFYVACAREMVVTGDWITPRLNVRPHDRPNETSVPFFEKPILTYWAAAAALRAFGGSEGAARIPAAAASLAATLLVVWAGARWIGRRAALFAGLAYATAPMVVLDARQMTTDALLTLWFLVAMIAYWERRPLVFSAACALGVLTKGVIGLLLPCLVVAVLHAARAASAGWHGQTYAWPRPTRRDWLLGALGAALFVAIALPWHVAIYRAGGVDAMGRTWVQEYLIRQHLGRFKGLDIHHNAPIFTYFGYFLIGFFPWACFTPFAFRLPPRHDALASTCAPRPSDRENETRRFLLCWFWTIFGFFSLSAAKLPTYIVPAYPAAALMVGHWLDRALISPAEERPRLNRGLAAGASIAVATAALMMLAAVIVPGITRVRPVMPAAIAALAIALTLITGLGCLTTWLCLRRAASGAGWIRTALFALTATMAALILITAGPGYAIIDRWLLGPYQDLAILARADAARGVPVTYYGIGDRRPSMLYYARDYSPIELRDTPLLPALAPWLAPRRPEAAVITLRTTFEKTLRAELARAGWAVQERSRRDSGIDTWLLLHIEGPAPGRAAAKRPPPLARHIDRRQTP